MISLLLLLLFPISIDSCLKVRSSVTTTPRRPSCTCDYRDFGKDDLESLSSMKFYASNLTYYPIIKSTSSWITGGVCDLTVSCPTGYTLMIGIQEQLPGPDSGTTINVYQYGTGLETQCDPYSQTWFIDDGVQEARQPIGFRGFCVNYTAPVVGTCDCPNITIITDANRAEYIGSFTANPIYSPTLNFTYNAGLNQCSDVTAKCDGRMVYYQQKGQNEPTYIFDKYTSFQCLLDKTGSFSWWINPQNAPLDTTPAMACLREGFSGPF